LLTIGLALSTVMDDRLVPVVVWCGATTK
jgi:hypothetical protein